MRLSEDEIKDIKSVIMAYDQKAEVYLFGSRVDNNKKGGDIDLLIFSTIINENNRRALKLALYDKIGEQKIDLVITSNLSEPFVRIILKKSISL